MTVKRYYCRDCGVQLLLKTNWLLSRKRLHQYICRKCHNIQQRKYWNTHGNEIQNSYRECIKGLKFNGCAICGYDGCISSLVFHHSNPEDKKFNIGQYAMGFASQKLITELNKCILLCANCHGEIEEKERREY